MKSKVYEITYPQATPSGVILEKNLSAKMRDGMEMALDVYKPREGKGPWPVLLAYASHRKEYLFESPFPHFYCRHGYVVVNAQTRGVGMSQGKSAFMGEYVGLDGYDIVEWIARQKWCNGKVGMMGSSGYAHTQWMTAVHNPPHLKCIVPAPGLTDAFRGFIYPGGVFHSALAGELFLEHLKFCLWPGPIPDKEPPENFILNYLANIEDGPFYWEQGAWNRINKIKTPVLNIVPANNHHSPTQLRSYPEILSPKKLIIIPYTYMMYMKYVFECLPLQQYALRWFDYWLKDIDTGIMDEPEVAIFDNGTGEWRYENEYPLARTEWKKWFLHEKTTETAPWGSISKNLPSAKEDSDTYRHPGGHFSPDMSLHAGERAAQPQFLAYHTPPLEEDLVVRGPLSITLYASISGKDISDWAFFIKIGEIRPEGSSVDSRPKVRETDAWTPPEIFMWSNGNLKAKFREIDEGNSRPGLPWHSFQNPTCLEPNVIYEFQIDLLPIFNTFKKGHKIWVQIASQDARHDTQDIHSTIGGPANGGFYPVEYQADIAIYHDDKHQSHLLMPVIPDAPELIAVSEPLSQILPDAPTIFNQD